MALAPARRGRVEPHKVAILLYALIVAYFVLPPLRLRPRGDGSGESEPFVPGVARALSVDERWSLREDAREMFYHGFDAYMAHGYPWDELKPLSCVGRRWDMRERGTLDDPLGGNRPAIVVSVCIHRCADVRGVGGRLPVKCVCERITTPVCGSP